ncbi:MAG: hypothetical protein J6T70_04120 [Bacteroidales bacterium]|nr:hypothetical protein [Bacteroidales bacterium]
MSDICTQLLNAVFFLAATQEKELCYNPEDGQIYQVANRSKADVTLLPLSGEDTPIFDFNPEKLIFRSGLSERSLNIAPETLKNAFETHTKRTDQHLQNVGETQTERDFCISGTQKNATEPQFVRDFIGVGKVDLPRFSTLYTGETAKICAQIETLLDKIFAATNYPKTIEKTLENYHNAKKLAKNGQLYELKQLADRLQGRINKQAAMQSAMNTLQAQNIAKRKMIFSAVAAALIAVLYFGVTHFYHNQPTEPPPTEYKAAFIADSGNELDKAIAEWEQTTGKKIYPAGRKCLERATKGMTKKQIIKVINQNIK